MPRFELEMPGPNMMTWSRGPRLGVTTDDVSGQLAEHFGVKQGQGVLVKEVMEGSAAAKAGLKAGDVIIRLNDETINEVGDLRKALNEAESREVTVTVVRDRREQSFQVTLDESQPRRPRRTAEAGQEIEQRAQQMAQEVRRRAAEMEDQMRDRVEAQLHRQQEVLQRSQERIQQREQELRQRRQLQEFQEKMREQERLYRELQYEREVI
jgi:membrane-associated protease RseP (regulator of RpoE activity)